jgi:FkbM family methyltransferase
MSMVTSWRDYPAGITGRTEKRLLEWFEREAGEGETWLDIGAHYGYTTLALARMTGPSGRVYAFEPFLGSAGHLFTTKRLNRLPQVRVIPMALGNGPELRVNRMAEVRGMMDSSLPAELGELYFEASLDWLWPRICERDAQIHGVKIDVQGMEIAVINGMKDILAQWRPKLALEFHGGVSRGEVLQHLTDAGYRLPGFAIDPVPEEQKRPEYLDDRSYAFGATA